MARKFRRKADAGAEEAPLASRMLRHKILSREEERDLLGLSEKGDTAARARLVTDNLRFVSSFARRFGPINGMEVDDAFQEGVIGELKAIGKFKLSAGTRLSTYASWWVRQAIQRAGQETGRTIRLPAPMLDKVRRLQRAYREAEASGVEPSETDIMEVTGFDKDELHEVARAATLLTTSLDAPVTEDGHTLADFCGDPVTGPESEFEHVGREERRLALRQACDVLSPVEVAVLQCRYEKDLTLSATAKAVAPLCRDGQTVSRERVRQIQVRALEKLRAVMSDADPF